MVAPVEELDPTCMLHTLKGGQQLTERVHIHKATADEKAYWENRPRPTYITEEKIYANHLNIQSNHFILNYHGP